MNFAARPYHLIFLPSFVTLSIALTGQSDELLQDPIPPGVIISPTDPELEAIEVFLTEIDAIEKQASEAKAAARKKLIERLSRREAAAVGEDIQPGLIGTAIVDGDQTGTAFHYHRGRIFDAELIWKKICSSWKVRWQSLDMTIEFTSERGHIRSIEWEKFLCSQFPKEESHCKFTLSPQNDRKNAG